MEETATLIAEKKRLKEQKSRKRRIIGWIALAVAVIGLSVGGWLFYRYLAQQEQKATLTTYQAVAVRTGEVKSVISGSGTLTANRSASFTAPGDYTRVETVNYQTGDTVAAGEVVMTLSCLEVEEQIETLEAELDDVLDELATVDQTLSKLTVTAPKKGVVKHIQAEEGTVVDDVDYLCLLSTDGKMKVVIEKPDGMKKYDNVTVVLEDGTEVAGLVTEFSSDGDQATITITDNSYTYGAAVTVVDESGAKIGEGTLDVNEYVKVNATSGRVAAVSCVLNKTYSKGSTLFKLADGAPTSEYLDYKKQRKDLEEQIQNLKEGLIITAEWDCMLTSLSVEKGDKLSEGEELCSLSSTDGYEMSLAIDELDIGSIRHGQAATVTLDAVEGTFAGTVQNISYSGSGNYVTSYTVSIVTEPIAGAYPGMSASAEVVIESSGESLLAPVGALQYEGRGDNRRTFVYVAADGTEAGASKTADAIDLDSLATIDVETGMSDGSYIVVTGEGLTEGTLIWQSTLTTTAVYNSSSSSTTTSSSFGGMGGMGGMPSGNFGGGMPSGNFGGMPGGNYGGNSSSGRSGSSRNGG